MTLTKNDLNAIGSLIDQKLDQKFNQELKPIKKELHEVKKLAIRIDKKTTKLVDFLDKDVMKATKRVDRIEDHLNLPSIND